jgi:hypothetical protein
VGHLLGSGTIGRTEAGAQGSLLEQIRGGEVVQRFNGGEERKFLLGGDTVCNLGVV